MLDEGRVWEGCFNSLSLSGFSLAEEKGRVFPQEGKKGAKVGKEERAVGYCED